MVHTRSRLFRNFSFGCYFVFLVSYLPENGCRNLAFLSYEILAVLPYLWQWKLRAFGLITVHLFAIEIEHSNRWYRNQIFLCLISAECNLIRIWLNDVKRRLWLDQNRVILVIRMLFFIFSFHFFRNHLESGHELILGITHKFLYLLIFQKLLRSVFLDTRIIPIDFLRKVWLKIISRYFIFFHWFFSSRMEPVVYFAHLFRLVYRRKFAQRRRLIAQWVSLVFLVLWHIQNTTETLVELCVLRSLIPTESAPSRFELYATLHSLSPNKFSIINYKII